MSSQSTVRTRQSGDLSLIETMRWEPDHGFLRLDQHMRRLSRSADALGFLAPADPAMALQLAVGGETPLRIRLTVTYRGKLEVTTTPFEPEPESKVWRLRIANQRLSSDDAFLRHKTTRRDVYEAARAEFTSGDADEVLMLNERGELCEGTMTNLFVEDADGLLLTPALSSGLLPGVLRAELIREGQARAEVLQPAALQNRRLFVGNSLRGLVPAELVND
ncbi:MAG: aminotransferase class IV family protein [Alphaproteobacteria bacterium]|nr:aminotransferase class IV family protein [Alphaproteobacteria bacterium]MBU1548373.1 aminotransferase class IV family protein [Alphaproteobacteria bacterium]MBU2335865.1 aminotransferase class IV family protein [Alphaproteobacteria bacterium]MBU2390740.1 aminotransferase class IV family protein [Alphaproteobacteria bacterium]